MPRSYGELCKEYRVSRGTTVYKNGEIVKINKDDYDVIVELTATKYARKEYKIVKNAPNLSSMELATICDRGKPPFGFSAGYNTISIYTD